MKNLSIPLWRKALYSLLFSTALGVLLVARRAEFNPEILVLCAVACMISWCYGTSIGVGVGHRATIERVQGELDSFVEKANKDIEKFKTKINRQVGEGDEWKQGGIADLDEPSGS